MVSKAKIVSAFQAAHTKIIEKKRQLVTVTRNTIVLDTEGRVTSSTAVSDTDVSVIIQPLLEEDRKLVGRGVSLEGFMKAYANESYDLTNLGDNFELLEGDLITDNLDTEFRVEEVVGREPVGGTEIVRVLLLRKLIA